MILGKLEEVPEVKAMEVVVELRNYYRMAIHRKGILVNHTSSLRHMLNLYRNLGLGRNFVANTVGMAVSRQHMMDLLVDTIRMMEEGAEVVQTTSEDSIHLYTEEVGNH